MTQVLSLLLSLVIAFVFGASLVSSWLEDRFWNTRLQLADLGMLPARWTIRLAAGAAIGETAAAILYSLPLHSWWRAAFASCLLLSLTAYLAAKRMRGRQSGCSCIGQEGFLNRYPIARNIELLAIVTAEALLPIRSWRVEAVIACDGLLAGVLTLWACRYVLPRRRRNRRAMERARSRAGAAYANAAYLRLHYSSTGFDAVNELLIHAPLPPMIVELHAPLWYAEGKRKAWQRHCVYAANDTEAQGSSAPILLWTTKRGKLRATTEIGAMLHLHAKKGERHPDVPIKSSNAVG